MPAVGELVKPAVRFDLKACGVCKMETGVGYAKGKHRNM